MTNYQIISLSTPILSVAIVGVTTYLFAIKSKKFDLLYASKIPAFKEIAKTLTEYRSFCLGRVAYYLANEASPYYNDRIGAFAHRLKIITVTDLNAIFLSKSNRDDIFNLIGSISTICSIELRIASKSGDTNDYTDVYLKSAKKTEALIEKLYKDLNLS